MEKRYGTLRFIGTVYKVLGVIMGLLTIVGSIGICLTLTVGGAAANRFGSQSGAVAGLAGGAFSAIFASVFFLLYGGAVAVSLYGLGEGVYLLIALEENTRATVQLLQQQTSKGNPTPGV